MSTASDDGCDACGLEDLLDADDTGQIAAHWETPASDVIVAWSCSEACARELEAKRGPDGALKLA